MDLQLKGRRAIVTGASKGIGLRIAQTFAAEGADVGICSRTAAAIEKAAAGLRSQGVKALYGRWLIEGNPRVLLFDTGSVYNRLDEWKGDLWNLAGIPTPPNDHETNETIVFGYIVAWFLGDVRVSLFSRLAFLFARYKRSCLGPLRVARFQPPSVAGCPFRHSDFNLPPKGRGNPAMNARLPLPERSSATTRRTLRCSLTGATPHAAGEADCSRKLGGSAPFYERALRRAYDTPLRPRPERRASALARRNPCSLIR